MIRTPSLQKPIKILAFTASFIFLLGIRIGPASAHDGENQAEIKTREVEIEIKINPADKRFKTFYGQEVTLTHAYLSTHSIEFVPCPEQQQAVESSWDFFNPFSIIIPTAQANHGVHFTKPTQIPIKKIHSLLETSAVNLEQQSIPIGDYCSIHYTIGHIGKIDNEHPVDNMELKSMYIKGKLYGDNSSLINVSGSYAIGIDIPVSLHIPAEKSSKSELDKALIVTLELDSGQLLKNLNFQQLNPLIVRQALLSISQNISVTVIH